MGSSCGMTVRPGVLMSGAGNCAVGETKITKVGENIDSIAKRLDNVID